MSLPLPPSKINFKLKYPDLFTATVGVITEIDVPKLQFLTTTGTGNHDQETFQSATQGLHGIAFSLKFRLKRKLTNGFVDYLMPPIETVWKRLDQEPEYREWKALLLQPVTINKGILQESIEIVALRHPETSLPIVVLESITQGPCLQTLHKGSYQTLPHTIAKMQDYAQKMNKKLSHERHEIYLNDPRKTSEKELETIVRIQIQGK